MNDHIADKGGRGSSKDLLRLELAELEKKMYLRIRHHLLMGLDTDLEMHLETGIIRFDGYGTTITGRYLISPEYQKLCRKNPTTLLCDIPEPFQPESPLPDWKHPIPDPKPFNRPVSSPSAKTRAKLRAKRKKR